jgi:PAS domain S-box-containing protein
MPDRATTRVVLGLGAYVAVTAAASFVGWPADVPRLADWDGDGIAIQPNASIAAMLAGLALLLVGTGRTTLASVCGAAVAAIGAATVFEHLSGVDLGIDTPLLFDRPWGRRGTLVPGRMGPPGSVSWTALGIALMCLDRGARARRAAAVMGTATTCVGFLSLTGYLYGADRLYTIPTVTVIAFQTATMVFAASLGLLFCLPEREPIRSLADEGAAGVLSRRLVPLILALPFVLGLLAVRGQTAGLYDAPMGTALLVLVLIVLLCVVLWWGARAVREYEGRLAAASRASQEAIAASEERYRSLVFITTDVPWSTNAEGAFVEHHEAWANYTGQSWDEMRNLGWMAAIHPDDRRDAHRRWTHAVADGGRFEVHVRLWHAATREHRHAVARATPLRAKTGEIRGWVGSCTDVHDARRAELAVIDLNAQLQISMQELQAVFRAAPVGIALSRDSQCLQVEVNEAFAEILGVPADTRPSLTGPDADHLPFRVTDEDGQPIAAADLPLQVAARTGTSVVGRILFIEREGVRTVIAGSAVPIPQGPRPSGGAIAVFVDVTRERLAAAEREELLAVAQAARVEAEAANSAKDEFLAVLSHELRAPLNAMLGWLQIMKRPGAEAALVARAVQTIERNIWAQRQVINDLLDITRIASGKFEMDTGRVDFTGVVVGAVDSIRPFADDKAVRIDLAVPERPLRVNGDPARLQQVVTNIVHNAIKFTPPSGRVAVDLREVDGTAEVEVRDTGQGIEPALLPRIFGRFVQGESASTRRHGGLGLGLAIVKQLIDRHGGTVSAASQGPGHGARFTVSLPLDAPRSSDATPAQMLAAPRHTPDIAGLKVLVVEDEQDSREALGIALEQAGARVRLTSSVAEALDAFAAHPPDVLVSDIGMPGADGYFLIETIRTLERDTGTRMPALAMTGFASQADYQRALAAGFDAHLAKPVEVAVLLERLHALTVARG